MFHEMGWVHTFEHVTAEGFSLDLAEPRSKLAVEVDGPSHYLKDGSAYVFNGATRLKSRLLRSFGWTVAHVPFFDWDHRSESERRQLVAAKLAELALSVAIEEGVAVKDDPSAIADTEAKDDDHGPVAADVVLSDEEDSDLMTPEPEPRPTTPIMAQHEFNVTENEPVCFEERPCLEGSTSTTTRANRRRKGRRKAKAPTPRAWRQSAVTFVLTAALGSYAVCMAYFLAATWRQKVGMAVTRSIDDRQRDVVGDPGGISAADLL